MARVQLALNVADLDASVAFYSKLFRTPPAKHHPGYANFAIAEPPLKLILIEGHGEPGSLNHLGVEVASSEEVVAATARLAAEGMRTSVEEQVACGYAVQDKVWVKAPEGGHWEIYTVLGDSDVAGAGCSVEACAPAGCAPAGCAPSSCAPAGRDGSEPGA
jgi:catechol 2,3-dioxygenase-like lactoylglutathione lyase family enzyme